MLSLLIGGCATHQTKIDKAQRYAENEDWLNSVLTYRRAVIESPGDIEFKSRLKQTELKAADYYYQKGVKLIESGNKEAAIVEFQQGLVAMPDHSKLNQAMKETVARQEADRLFSEALSNYEAEIIMDAKAILERAIKISPGHKKSQQLLKAIEKFEGERWIGKLALSSKETITLNFRQTELKTAFEFLANSFGINVVFDNDVKDETITLFAKDVTFKQAINLLLVTTQTFYKEIGVNTVLVAPDTREKRERYEDLIIRNYSLRAIPAKDMASILKGLLGIKNILINESQNMIIVRSEAQKLHLAEQIIAANDRKPAELILDVEILEVNRTKAEQIGLDIGSQITVTYGEIAGSISQGISDGAISLPPTVLRFYKQDVDAKTLANPKVRVIDGNPAKIHIGDRVPLRSSTIQDATGQTRTTFEYKDIGIKLTVEPDIHIDNSVTVKMGLEVSTLGQNLGTQDEPAYSIGTRNADTMMLLRDGETAILGGLIRDEDRNANIKVPGLGDIPALGNLFTTNDSQRTRTDVLLTITPRIVRSWDAPPEDLRSLYSGTSKQFSTKPIFDYLKSSYSETHPNISFDKTEAVVNDSLQDEQDTIESKLEISNNTVVTSLDKEEVELKQKIKHKLPIFGFDRTVYETTVEGEFEVSLVGKSLGDMSFVPLEILYNPKLIKYVESANTELPKSQVVTQSEQEKGRIKVNVSFKKNTEQKDDIILAKLRLTALKPGISYLVYRAAMVEMSDGESVSTELQTARINVK
jgi:general secretion pathway protein D